MANEFSSFFTNRVWHNNNSFIAFYSTNESKTNALISFLPERPYFSASMSVNAMMDYFEDFYADFDYARAEEMLQQLIEAQKVQRYCENEAANLILSAFAGRISLLFHRHINNVEDQGGLTDLGH